MSLGLKYEVRVKRLGCGLVFRLRVNAGSGVWVRRPS